MQNTILHFKVFNLDEVNELNEKISKIPFFDGKLTASGNAKKNKNNQQITMGSTKEGREFLLQLQKKLVQNNAFRNLTFFKRFADIIINKYSVGDTYGWHYDNHLINHIRTDISFTLFLSDPNAYAGGELEIKGPGGVTQKIKGAAGEIILYPTSALHQVTPISKGERVSIVGWIQSWVERSEDRDALNLFNSELNLIKPTINYENYEKLKGLYHHFFRKLSS